MDKKLQKELITILQNSYDSLLDATVDTGLDAKQNDRLKYILNTMDMLRGYPGFDERTRKNELLAKLGRKFYDILDNGLQGENDEVAKCVLKEDVYDIYVELKKVYEND